MTHFLPAITFATAIALSVSANANLITVDASLTGLPTAGFTVVALPATLGTATFMAGISTVSFVGVTSPLAGDPRIGVVNGDLAAIYAAPVTGQAGGNPTYVTSNYLAVASTGYIDIAFSTPQSSFALLWGSVDKQNTIAFLNNGSLVDGSLNLDAGNSVTGSQASPLANGSQVFGGTEYTLINSSTPFTELQFSSQGQPSFEFAQFETDPNNYSAVPEPASVAIFGLGLLGLAAVRRKISDRTTAASLKGQRAED